jgi:hypothetical protein
MLSPWQPKSEILHFLLSGRSLFRTARSGQGRAAGASGAALDGEDRSETIAAQGNGRDGSEPKHGSNLVSIGGSIFDSAEALSVIQYGIPSLSRRAVSNRCSIQ